MYFDWHYSGMGEVPSSDYDSVITFSLRDLTAYLVLMTLIVRAVDTF